jgi:hypothetical protein
MEHTDADKPEAQAGPFTACLNIVVGAGQHKPCGIMRAQSWKCMRALWMIVMVVAATLSFEPPATAQYAMKPFFRPYRANTTEKRLASLFRATQPFLSFRDKNARALWNSMYVDCVAFGIEDRYVFYDTLFRVSLLWDRAVTKNPMTYLEIYSTPADIIVTVVVPPMAARPHGYSLRLAAIDRTGRFLVEPFRTQALKDACEGSQGDIYIDGQRLSAGPPR